MLCCGTRPESVALLSCIPTISNLATSSATSVADEHGIRSSTMPSSVIVGEGGGVRHVHAGFEDGDEAKVAAEVKTLATFGPSSRKPSAATAEPAAAAARHPVGWVTMPRVRPPGREGPEPEGWRERTKPKGSGRFSPSGASRGGAIRTPDPLTPSQVR
jgi:hypothetical protein